MERATKRKAGSYAKGAARREALLDAAEILLETHDLDKLALKDIAEKASIPVGSAYHFFANSQDLFVALALRFTSLLSATIAKPYSGAATRSWQNLFDAAIDRAAKLYGDHPAYRQLIIGGKSPPEIKLADRKNDEQVGQLMRDVIARHFKLDRFSRDNDVFFYATEIVDLMFSLSVIQNGVIKPAMVSEAKVAGKAYLNQYLPTELHAN